MSEGARRASVDDLAAITTVLETVVPEVAEQRGGATFLVAEGAALQPLAEALDDPDSVVLVGTYDDVVLGVATMRFVERADGRTAGKIERLVVDADARASGIGEAMMNELLEACEARGCAEIESVALPGDRHTKNFFESFGLKARMLTVARSLSDRSAKSLSDPSTEGPASR
ncbi:MAG: GNAT family N-acetyltransferase [Acidimicrobiales bacterium]